MQKTTFRSNNANNTSHQEAHPLLRDSYSSDHRFCTLTNGCLVGLLLRRLTWLRSTRLFWGDDICGCHLPDQSSLKELLQIVRYFDFTVRAFKAFSIGTRNVREEDRATFFACYLHLVTLNIPYKIAPTIWMCIHFYRVHIKNLQVRKRAS